jgi:hypothetical protein
MSRWTLVVGLLALGCTPAVAPPPSPSANVSIPVASALPPPTAAPVEILHLPLPAQPFSSKGKWAAAYGLALETASGRLRQIPSGAPTFDDDEDTVALVAPGRVSIVHLGKTDPSVSIDTEASDVAFGPQARSLVYRAGDTLHLFEVDSRFDKNMGPPPTVDRKFVPAFRFGADGRLLVWGSAEGAYAYDRTERLVRSRHEPTKPVADVQPGGEFVASFHPPRLVLWAHRTRKEVLVDPNVESFALSADGATVATVAPGARVFRIRSVPSGKTLSEAPLPGTEPGDSVRFACNEQRFRATVLGAAGLAFSRHCGPTDEALVEPASGKVISTKRRTAADRAVEATEYVRLCGRAGFSGCAAVSDALTRAGRPFWFGAGDTLALASGPEGRVAVVSRADASIKLLLGDSETQHLGPTSAVSPTHDRLLGVDGTGTLRLWDLGTGKVLVARSVKAVAAP